jgi:hypothetical protein
MEYSGAGGKLIHEKNQKQKISWHCPFKVDHTFTYSPLNAWASGLEPYEYRIWRKKTGQAKKEGPVFLAFPKEILVCWVFFVKSTGIYEIFS